LRQGKLKADMRLLGVMRCKARAIVRWRLAVPRVKNPSHIRVYALNTKALLRTLYLHCSMGKDNVEDRQDLGLSQKSNPEERGERRGWCAWWSGALGKRVWS
jgi:hypothetical protein